MNMTLKARAALAAFIAVTAGCSQIIGERPGHFPPSLPQQAPPAGVDGAIYQQSSSLTLFEDQKARRIGDTLTIQLAERTQAS